jgi:hypothetical protein
MEATATDISGSLKPRANSKEGAPPVPSLKKKLGSLDGEKSSEEASEENALPIVPNTSTKFDDEFLLHESPITSPGLHYCEVFHGPKNTTLFTLSEDRDALIFEKVALDKLEEAFHHYLKAVEINPAIGAVNNIIIPIATTRDKSSILSITFTENPVGNVTLEHPNMWQITARLHLARPLAKALKTLNQLHSKKILYSESAPFMMASPTPAAELPVESATPRTPRMEAKSLATKTQTPRSLEPKPPRVTSRADLIRSEESPRLNSPRLESPRHDLPNKTLIKSRNKIFLREFSDYAASDLVDESGKTTQRFENLRQIIAVRQNLQKRGYTSPEGETKSLAYTHLADPEGKKVVSQRFLNAFKKYLDIKRPNFFAKILGSFFGSKEVKAFFALEIKYHEMNSAYVAKQKIPKFRTVTDSKITKRVAQKEDDAKFETDDTIKNFLKKELSFSWLERNQYLVMFNSVKRPENCNDAQFNLRRHTLAVNDVMHTRAMSH